ncbi:MAG: signal peptidase I [Flavobacteriales bacterium]|nr:signal peptidase I [Flavobacteriales bacterium]
MDNIFTSIWENNPGIFLVALFLGLVAVVANWRLFVKCGQSGLAAFIPIYNIVVALRIVGRPDSHIFFFLIPIYGQLIFPFIVTIDLLKSFGKYHWVDYILALVFNIFYILNLGLAYNEDYYGPAYGMSIDELKQRKPVLA